MIPVKNLDRAKSRLLGAADGGIGDRAAHEALVLALVRDTVIAAASAPHVRRVLAVTSDPTVIAVLTADGIDTIPDIPDNGLNAAVTFGAAELLRRDAMATVAALQSDLPALRPAELGAALGEADGRRAFCADRQGTGSTLLVAPQGRPLDPRFGAGSAVAHTTSGARAITASLPSLRCDVDTAEDLAVACRLGLGAKTATLIGNACCP